MKKLILFLTISFFATQFVLAQQTEVWLVRHAEKDTSNPEDKNPNLSDEGKIRAGDLAKHLKKVKFDAAFTTPTKRTHQTLDSLLIPKVIEYKEIKALVDSVKNVYQGKTVIVAAHSNTILEIIEAFGAKKPLDIFTEDDYDYIFRLSVTGDKAKVKTDHYGRPHRL